jgi:hypothetical protein
VSKRSTDAGLDIVVNYTRVGLKRELNRFCAGLISFLFSDPPCRTILDKRRIDNQIGVHPFLCHHLIGMYI